jgi:peroxiredoxin
LQSYAQYNADFEALGYRVVAISPESSEHLAETIERFSLPYEVWHDQDMAVALAFKVAYDMDPALVDAFQQFGLDVAKFNGMERAMLPITATYIIGTDMTVQYAWLGDDYTERVEPDALLARARELAGE